MSDDSDDSWPEATSPEEAINILSETVFEFADVILNLCLCEEKLHAKKYVNGTIKPSTKIRVMTGLLKIFSKERLIEHYTNYVLNWKSYIDDRNDKFFLENDHIYPKAPKEDIEFFRNLWREESDFHLNPEEKETVYEYFDTMIHYCQEWKNMTGFKAKWQE